MSDQLPVAALCVSGRSIYKHLPGVVAFDRERDARSFGGYMPVVAHPPCRLWSKFLAAQAKCANPPAEKSLGLWCVRMVRTWGGVLEHPAHSRLFAAARMPLPSGQVDAWGGFTLYVEQQWFGYATPKATWVYVCGVPKRSIPPVPFLLVGASRAEQSGLSATARARSVAPFAEWLCQISRLAWSCKSDRCAV